MAPVMILTEQCLFGRRIRFVRPFCDLSEWALGRMNLKIAAIGTFVRVFLDCEGILPYDVNKVAHTFSIHSSHALQLTHFAQVQIRLAG